MKVEREEGRDVGINRGRQRKEGIRETMGGGTEVGKGAVRD